MAFAYENRFTFTGMYKKNYNYFSSNEMTQRYMSTFCFLLTEIVTLYGHWIPISKKIEKYAPHLYHLLTRPTPFKIYGTEKLTEAKNNHLTNLPVICSLFLNLYVWDRQPAFKSPKKTNDFEEYWNKLDIEISKNVDKGTDFFNLVNPIREKFLNTPEKGDNIPLRGKFLILQNRKHDMTPGTHLDLQWDEMTKLQVKCKFSDQNYEFHEYLHALCTGGFRNPNEVEFFNSIEKSQLAGETVETKTLMTFLNMKSRSRTFEAMWEIIERSFKCFEKTKKVKGKDIPDYDKMMEMMTHKDFMLRFFNYKLQEVVLDRDPTDHKALFKRLFPSEEERTQNEAATGETQNEERNAQEENEDVVTNSDTSSEEEDPAEDESNQAAEAQQAESKENDSSDVQNDNNLVQPPQSPIPDMSTLTWTPHTNINATIPVAVVKQVRTGRKTVNSVAQDSIAQGIHAAALEAVEVHYKNNDDCVKDILKNKGVPHTDLFQRIAFVWQQTAFSKFAEKLKEKDPTMSQDPVKSFKETCEEADPDSFLLNKTEESALNMLQWIEADERAKNAEALAERLRKDLLYTKTQLNHERRKNEDLMEKCENAREVMMDYAVTAVQGTAVLEKVIKGQTTDLSKRLSLEECLPLIEEDVLKKGIEGDSTPYRVYSEWLDEYGKSRIKQAAEEKIVDMLVKNCKLEEGSEARANFGRLLIDPEKHLWTTFLFYVSEKLPKEVRAGGCYNWENTSIPREASKILESFDSTIGFCPLDEVVEGEEEENLQELIEGFDEVSKALENGAKQYLVELAENFMLDNYKDDTSIAPKNWHSKKNELKEKIRKMRDKEKVKRNIQQGKSYQRLKLISEKKIQIQITYTFNWYYKKKKKRPVKRRIKTWMVSKSF